MNLKLESLFYYMFVIQHTLMHLQLMEMVLLGIFLILGTDLAILSFGAHLEVAIEAAQLLEQQGISVTVADARFAKPLDTDLVDSLVESHAAVLTLEQGSMGGFGAIVLQHLAVTGQLADGINIDTVFLPDRFIDQGSPDDMYRDAEMSLSHVFDRCIKVFQRSDAQKLALPRQSVNNN